MSNAELSKMIKKYLIPVIGNEYSIKGNILYKVSVTDIILGYCFERLANDKNGFYLWAFAQPLYISTEDFNLTFGNRLKGKKSKSERWELSKDAFEELASIMKTDGQEYLENISTANKFYKFFKRDKSGSIRVMEAVVYSEFYCEIPEANDDAEALIKYLHKKEDMSIGWIREIQHNVERLLDAGKKSKQEVRSILDEWKQSSIKNLGI